MKRAEGSHDAAALATLISQHDVYVVRALRTSWTASEEDRCDCEFESGRSGTSVPTSLGQGQGGPLEQCTKIVV